MTPTETLARWLHETGCRLAEQDLAWQTWKGMPAAKKQPYRAVAAELLTNPPQVLLDAIRERSQT